MQWTVTSTLNNEVYVFDGPNGVAIACEDWEADEILIAAIENWL